MPCAAALRFSNAAALRFSNAERQAVAFFLRCLIVALAPTYCGLAVAQDNGGTIAGIMWGLEASASVSTYFGRFPDFSGTSASFSPITGCCWTDGAQPGSWYGYPGQGNLGM